MSCINNQLDINVFINHPSEQQVKYALTEEEIINAIRQEEKGDNLEDDSTKIQKISYWTQTPKRFETFELAGRQLQINCKKNEVKLSNSLELYLCHI